MSHSTVRQHCTVQKANGSFCDSISAPDVPFPICGKHAYRLWQRMNETLREAETDFPRLLKLSFDQIDEKRAREDKRNAGKEHVIYYVLVGDLCKIGTTGTLRQRLHSYPPNRKLLATEPGSYDIERRRHMQFADLLEHGNEWFRFEGLLVEHIKRLRRRQERLAAAS